MLLRQLGHHVYHKSHTCTILHLAVHLPTQQNSWWMHCWRQAHTWLHGSSWTTTTSFCTMKFQVLNQAGKSLLNYNIAMPKCNEEWEYETLNTQLSKWFAELVMWPKEWNSILLLERSSKPFMNRTAQSWITKLSFIVATFANWMTQCTTICLSCQ